MKHDTQKKTHTPSNSRTQAALILQAVIYKGESLSALLLVVDDPFTRDLCFGCLRWHEPLSALLNVLLSKPLKKKDKDVECLIRVGLYQIIYQNTPDHAAVGETVSALKGLKKPWAKKLVNAVLRNYLRRHEKLQSTIMREETVKYAFPAWLIERFKVAWPDRWEGILQESNRRAPMTLRVNVNHQTRAEYLSKLAQKGIEASELEAVNTAIQLNAPCSVFDLPGFKHGEVSVQDGAAQVASLLLDCKEGMQVLDACAAPGGKTGHILESAKDLKVTALDNSESRLVRVQQNLDRLKLIANIVHVDALDTEAYAKKHSFDRILLDAPCSATGVIRRHPDIKLLRRPSDIKELSHIQQKMLDAMWGLLKPAGIMVYATCSILPEENEEQINAFLSRHDDVEVRAIEKAQGFGRQIFPGEDSMDGFYFCKLKKVELAQK